MEDRGRYLNLRRADTCCACQTHVPVSWRAWWDPQNRTVTCTRCRPESSLPGASAHQIETRRRAGYQTDVREQHPHLGGLILRLRDEPPRVTRWEKGAAGERQLGNGLDRLASTAPIWVLHDRKNPGSRANIDTSP